MANLAVTSDSVSVTVVFNVYAESANMNKASFRRADIIKVSMAYGADYITIEMIDGALFDINFAASSHSMVVDSIDGVTPTSNADLFTKIKALML